MDNIAEDSIERLNDDCLIEIFRYLSEVSDKLRLERVCKRWQRILTQKSWSNLKYFDILLSSRKCIPNYKKLKERFAQYGNYLTTVISDVKTFSKVCDLAPNLENLKLVDTCIIRSGFYWELAFVMKSHSCRYDTNNCIAAAYRCLNMEVTKPQCRLDYGKYIFWWLSKYSLCQNITTFHMELSHDHHYSEYDFISFLAIMKKLKSFRLSGCEYFNSRGGFLLNRKFPSNTIEDISLETANKLPFNNFLLCLLINKCPMLKKVALEGLELDDFDLLCGALIFRAATLKSLTLVTTVKGTKALMYSCIAHLENLEKLVVNFSRFVTDEFLKIVGRYCKKLKQLNINYCEAVTDKGISNICGLKDLIYLQMRDLKHVKSPPLQKLKNLVALDCGWNEIEEQCLCNFLQKAHRLRALFISQCDNITYKFLNAAVEVVKQQKSERVLDINIAYVEIDLEKISGSIPSNLNIITECPDLGIEKFDIDDWPFERKC